MNTFTDEYRFSCYQKIKTLDGNGSIWLVENSVTGRQYTMRRLSLTSAAVYERLLEISHPHIVKVWEVFRRENFLYVVEEYLQGRLLSDILSEKRMPRRQIRKAAGQILTALDALHGHQIIYRDLKPENIMVDERDGCKLFDFDIARVYDREKERDTSSRGTRDYAPPEQFGFGQTDARSDIYAFGVTLNIMATGCFPARKLSGGRLGGIVRRCVEFDPKRRYQNVGQILRHIRFLKWEKAMSLSVFFLVFVLLLGVSFGRHRQVPALSSVANAGRNDRMVRLGGQMDAGDYPALLLTDQEKAVFEAGQVFLEGTTVCAEKTDDCLRMDIAVKDRESVQLLFSDHLKEGDVWADAYGLNLQETEPEYEILLHDMDQNGKADLVVTLCRRKKVETPDPVNNYDLAAYSVLWAVYWDDREGPVCSEPLFFSGMPTLTADGILQDDLTREWIGLENGIWKLY